MKDLKKPIRDELIERVMPKIRHEIEMRCLKQREVAEIVGFNQPTVSKFLNMEFNDELRENFSAETIYHVAQCFNISIKLKIN